MLARNQDDPQSTAPHQRARGTGDLVVSARNGKMQVERLYQSGCAKIRIPRTNGPGMEAIMINSSGGMTGGDQLEWKFDIGAGARATVTSQACERVYKTSGGVAQTDIKLTVGAGGRLTWIPQETIMFNRAGLTRIIEANIAETGNALLVEPIIFGRQAMGEIVREGHLHDRWRIRRGSQLIHSEDLKLTGDIAGQLTQPFIMGNNGALATVLLISDGAEGYVTQARSLISSSDGISAWNGKLLARVMAEDGYLLRKKLLPLLNLLNFEAPVPKVWSL
jgi:urease accessory protein